MKTTKITDSEIRDLKVASLPTRPNASVKYGGYGYSAQEMKAAFDRLPLFIIQKFNSLIEDICADGDGIADSVQTGLADGHTLSDLFGDVESGALASYLTVGSDGASLSSAIRDISERLARLEEKINGEK